MTLPPLDAWEALWAPYDEATYNAVLAAVGPEDVVLEIGAGDLRLARQLAAIARRVIAWEVQADLITGALSSGPLPPNLVALQADARIEPVPEGVTVAALLMRHCSHANYTLYTSRLRAAGGSRLITNARWHMGVEVLDLAPGLPFESALPGWYTCRKCGSTGFIEPRAGVSPTGELDAGTIDRISDVEGCPACRDAKAAT